MKYKAFEGSILSFFEQYKYKNLTSKDTLPLRSLDFVIFNDKNELIEGAEIKTFKETSKSFYAWFSYHKNTLKVLKGINSLSPKTKGFVAVIYGQMTGYIKRLRINHLWLIQEGKNFETHIDLALKYLKSLNKIREFYKYKYLNFLFYRINFI